MFYLSRISATSPSSVAGMTRHLMNATLAADRNMEAIELSRGSSIEHDWHRLAAAVLDGDLKRSEAIAELMQPWLRTANYGTPKVWDHANIVQAQIEDRFDALTERVGDGTAFAPLAILRPDTEAGVSRALGILPGMLLDTDNINALLAGRRIDGGQIADKTYARVVEGKSAPIGSYDFCCTAPKSFSVAWAFATPVEQARLLAIHTQAAREGAAYIADELGVARFGKMSVDREDGAVTWLEFTHHTARRVQIRPSDVDGHAEVRDSGKPGDPSVHTHFLFPNAVFTPSGRVGTIDAYRAGGFIKEAGQFYQARLATLLGDAGYDTASDRHGFAKMPIIPDRVADCFSKRHAYGLEMAARYTEQRGEVWADLDPAQQIVRVAKAINDPRRIAQGDRDDRADFDNWRQQAKDIGWEPPRSFELIGPQTLPLTATERHQSAYETAVRHLEPQFERRAVLSHYDLRYAALRGLIETGTTARDSRGRIADVDAITKMMRERGVLQYGEQTPLVWGKEGGGNVSVTTQLHIEQEKEFIDRLKAAHADTSGALRPSLLSYHVGRSNLDFTDAHGKNQLQALMRAGTGSRFELIEAAAGAGKTSSLKPIIAARLEQKWSVYGASLAWQQADALTDAGITKRNVYALDVLLTRLHSGDLRLDRNSLVALDEYGLLGTRQGLELLRWQNRQRFSIIALGDQKQLSAVEAGDIIALTKTALGASAVPSIETTQRQKGREAEIAGLLRRGKDGAAEAIAMKREDGTAIMAHGGRSATVKAVVDLAMERQRITGKLPTISVQTNREAHQINLALREAKQAAGVTGADLYTRKATDRQDEYVMRLAKGDTVRLLKSTGGRYLDPDPATGRTTAGSVGRNGTVLTVVSAGSKGLTVRTTTNRLARIDWAALTDPANKTGRVLLAYGDATTMHRSQGATSPEHIWALLDGSAKISGAAAYSAATRHTDRSWLVTNAEAETIAVKQGRALNDPAPVGDDDRWAHVAKRLSWQPEKDTATALAARVETLHRGTVDLLHKVASSQAMLDQRQRGRASAGAAQTVQTRHLDIAWAAAQRTVAATLQTVRNAFERD
jgi:hypothetical protein